MILNIFFIYLLATWISSFCVVLLFSDFVLLERTDSSMSTNFPSVILDDYSVSGCKPTRTQRNTHSPSVSNTPKASRECTAGLRECGCTNNSMGSGRAALAELGALDKVLHTPPCSIGVQAKPASVKHPRAHEGKDAPPVCRCQECPDTHGRQREVNRYVSSLAGLKVRGFKADRISCPGSLPFLSLAISSSMMWPGLLWGRGQILSPLLS